VWVFFHKTRINGTQWVDKWVSGGYLEDSGTIHQLFENLKGGSQMRTLLTSAGVACAILLALCFAALSGAYWFIELQAQEFWQIGLAVAASICVSLMTPVCAYFMRSHGYVLVLAVAIFFAADTYQNAQGWQTFKGLSSSVEIQEAKDRLTSAKDQLVNLPTPDANGAIRQKSTYTDTKKSLQDDIAFFQDDVDRLSKPETPLLHVAAIMGLIQIALSIFFACMGKPKETRNPAVEVANENTVVRFSHRPKPMDDKDLKAWNAISKSA
jgi:hypothetical protein